MKWMHMISIDRDHSEGRAVGVNGCLEPFQKFISFGTLTRSVDCLVLIFLNTILEKTNPEITLLYQFHAQQAQFKVSKI